MYPQVCALLSEGDTRFPQQFDICIKRRLGSGNAGETRIRKICLDGHWIEQMQQDSAVMDQLLTHEMAHVAQDYYRPIIGRWLMWAPDAPAWWQEGIADYVCFRLGQTNGWSCPECSFAYPDYRSGYTCAGAFLLHLEQTYNPNIVRRLNATLRDDKYSDDFFLENTGKTLESLWAEFQQTPAFKPGAAHMLELQAKLGFQNGKPPKDIERRLRLLLEEASDPTAKKLIERTSLPGLTRKNIQTRLALIWYFTQPGGTAEAFMVGLSEKQQLPGFAKGEHGTLNGLLKTLYLNPAFPVTRSFTATKTNDPSLYHYTVSRTSAETQWKLQRAWRTAPDGTEMQEYLIP